MNTMVASFGKIFNGIKPVYDGKKSMYSKDPLPIGYDKIELEGCAIFFLTIMIAFWFSCYAWRFGNRPEVQSWHKSKKANLHI